MPGTVVAVAVAAEAVAPVRAVAVAVEAIVAAVVRCSILFPEPNRSGFFMPERFFY